MEAQHEVGPLIGWRVPTTRCSARLRQRGESRIGCIFWLLVLLGFAGVCWQMVPVKMKSLDLDQTMIRLAERASLQQRNTEKQLRTAILQAADELGLPLEDDNLIVRRTGARVSIEASYTVPINLLVTTWDWKVTHKIERSIMRV